MPIESVDGTPYEIRNRVTLCRSGVSINKPFCNGSHASINRKDGLYDFQKVETPVSGHLMVRQLQTV